MSGRRQNRVPEGSPRASQIYRRLYSRRQILKAGALGTAGLMIGACGGEETPGTTAAPSTTAAPATTAARRTVPVLFDYGYAGIPGSMGQFWDEVTTRAAAEGIDVEGTEVALEDLAIRIEAAHAAEAGPSIETFYPNYSTFEFLEQGAIQPLDPLVGGDAEIDHWLFESQPFGGLHYNAPLLAEISMLVANREIFNNAGVDLPDRFASWEDMIAALQKIKSAGDVPVIIGSSDGFNSEKWVMASEMGFLDRTTDLTEWNLGLRNIDEPLASGWIDNIAQLRADKLINDDADKITEHQALERFTAGEAGMMMLYPGAVFALEEDRFDVVGYWKGPGAASAPLAVGGSGMVVTSFAEDPQAAGDLIAFLHRPEQSKLFNEITSELPCDDRFDSSGLGTLASRTWGLITDPDTPPPFWVHDFMHYDVIFSIIYPLSQEAVAGTPPGELRTKYNEQMEAWREGNEEAMGRVQGFYDAATA